MNFSLFGLSLRAAITLIIIDIMYLYIISFKINDYKFYISIYILFLFTYIGVGCVGRVAGGRLSGGPFPPVANARSPGAVPAAVCAVAAAAAAVGDAGYC